MARNYRNFDEMRKSTIMTNFTENAYGSVLAKCGKTAVLCTATVEEKVPVFKKGTGEGWITAEYSLLPGSTGTRTAREAARGKITGRTAEIQRLIGRALRSVVDFKMLGERTIWVDCDVLDADGGTRTTAINGAYVALVLALRRLKQEGKITHWPLQDAVAAVSVGSVGGISLLDLEYGEDSVADVDMNIVMSGKGDIIEIQGTGERHPFTRDQLATFLELAEKGVAEVMAIQAAALALLTED